MNDFTTELIRPLVEGTDITEIFRYYPEKSVTQLPQNALVLVKMSKRNNTLF